MMVASRPVDHLSCSPRRSPRILAAVSNSPSTKEPFRCPIGSAKKGTGGNKDDRMGTPLSGGSKRKSGHLTPLRKEGKARRRSEPSKSDDSAPPMTSHPDDFPCSLPNDVQATYRKRRKINKLYDWQKECLSDSRLMAGSNCIVSLPTGAGKTLIAEILMLREAVIKNRSSILILPYVAIVQEKMTSLACLEEEFGIKIEEYAASKGRLPPIKRRNSVSIYVATIEKANMLINSLIETDRLKSIGLLVVDELHMLGEGSRGAVLEQLLIKFQRQGSGQIVGLSATLSNIEQLATFLRAHVYSTNFRPIALDEFVRIGQTMYKVQPDGLLDEGTLLPSKGQLKNDPDGLCNLLKKIIPNKSAIVFCPTKKNCENVAMMIAHNLPREAREKHLVEKLRLVAAMKEDNDGKLDDTLERLLMSGLSYHHSGLTHDERKFIEAAYAEGILCVLCATSTLAAGVNLPARRVIIKSPYVGMSALGKAQYLQMVGRAGRAGFDDRGDAITIVREGKEQRQFCEMLSGPMLSCISSLSDIVHLSAFILDLITLKVATCLSEILEVLRFSLLFVQKGEEEVKTIVERALDELREKNLIGEDKDQRFISTELGSATFAANFNPSEACRLATELMKSLNQGLVFSSHFHLLFTISPYDAVCSIDWDVFHIEYKGLSQSEKTLLANSGLSDKHIIHCITKTPRLNAGEAPMRLYISLMLQRIWNQESPWSVAERFRVDRGWLQSVLQNSVSQAAAIARFSEKQPSMWPLRLLLPELVQRLSDCVRVELIPLLSIDGVKRGRARQLYAAGFTTVGHIAKSDAKSLMGKVEHLNSYQAAKIVNNAKALLRDQIDEKLEEMEAMGIDVTDISV